MSRFGTSWIVASTLSLCLGCGSRDLDEYAKGMSIYDSAQTAEELETAIDHFDEALKDQKDAKIFISRGLTYDALERTEEAIADYQAALEIEPKNIDAMLNLGADWHEMGEFQRAVDIFTQIIEIDNQDIDAHRNRGLANSELGNLDVAVVDLTWAITLLPDIDPVLYRERAAVWKALDNQRQCDLDEAVADATLLIEKNQDDAAAYATRGQALNLLGEYAFAVNDFDEAIRVDPQNSHYYSGRGRARSILGNLDNALEDYNAAIERDAENVEAYLGRGAARQTLGKWGLAIADYRKAIELDAQATSPKAGLAWILAACPDDDLRSGEEARTLAQGLGEQSEWKNWLFVDIYAAACAEVGDFDEAVRREQLAIELAAEDVDPVELDGRLKLYEQQQPYRLSTAL